MIDSTESPRPEAPSEEASHRPEARQTEEAPQAPAEASSEAEQGPRATPQEAASASAPAAEDSGGRASEAQQADEATSETAVASEAADPAPAATAAEAGAEGTPEAAQPEASEAAAAQSAEGESKAKKKRRKRKKKKAAASGEGKPAASHAALSRFFTNAAAKKHAFAVGEVIAGRVVKADEGAVVVDLFGKAKAIADVREPREIAVDAGGAEQAESEPATSASEDAAAPAVDPSAEATTPPAEAALGSVEPATPQAGETQDAVVGTTPTASGETEASRDEPEAAPADPAAEAAATEASEPEPSAEADAAPGHVAEVGVQAHEGPPETVPSEGQGDAHAGSAAAPAAGEADAGSSSAPASGDAAAEAQPAEPEPEPPTLGQIFRGRVGVVAESGHIGIVNRKVDRGQVRARLDEAREQHRRVEGVVFGYNRGGFDVLIDGARAFCPASGMSLDEIDDPEAFVGRKLEFSLPPSKAGGKDIIVSRRSILEKEQRKRAKALLRSLETGERRKGKVTQIRDFGVFVDLGGVEGLVHQSELSYDRSVRPADVANVGDEVEVQVLKVGGDGASKKERQRVSLSLKALQPDPWDEHREVLREGAIRKGIVRRTTDFGAFVELAPKIEGLVHITELGRSLKHANQVLNESDEILVSIDRVDRKSRKISLSKLTAEEAQAYEEGKLDEEPKPQSLRPGSTVTVRIEKIEPRGMQVRVLGAVGKRARGFLPNSELGNEDSGKGRKGLSEGSELDVKIVGSDRDHRLKLSRKAYLIDEERRAVKEYRKEASKKGLGTFGDLLKSKLGEITPKQ